MCGVEKLFIRELTVPPSRFRPVRILAGERMDHPQTVTLRRVVEECQVTKAVFRLLQGEKSQALVSHESFYRSRIRGGVTRS